MKIKNRTAQTAGGGIVFNKPFEGLLRKNRLDAFDRIMAVQDGAVIKHAVPERKTVRLTLNKNGTPFAVYLKRHYPLSFWKYCRQLLTLSPPKTALDEYLNIIAFHRAGIPTVTPVAAGVQKTGLLQGASFLMTQALEPGARLDHLFAQSPGLPFREKRRLLRQAALLVNKMHRCGFNHRDLYLCHMLRSSGGGLFILDLHRVDRRTRVPARWLVKDLAALHYSSLHSALSRTDRLFFLSAYLDRDRLVPEDRRLIRKILKKSEKMVRHNTKGKRMRDEA